METELGKEFEPRLEKEFGGGRKMYDRNLASLLLDIDSSLVA
jgi:hypothetical protein